MLRNWEGEWCGTVASLVLNNQRSDARQSKMVWGWVADAVAVVLKLLPDSCL